jgi:hypothetical protein
LVLGAQHAEQGPCGLCAESLEQVVEVVDREQAGAFAELGDELERVAELLDAGP